MPAVTRISPDEAKALLDLGYVYLDVRTEAEYAAGHPAHAYNVPLLILSEHGPKPNPEFVTIVRALYPLDTKIVVGCLSGQRSLRAAEMLLEAGYTEVREQRAGYAGVRDAFGQILEVGWQGRGLPTETTTSGRSYAELKQKASG